MFKTRLEKFNDKIVSEDFILLYNFKNIAQLNRFEQGTISSTSNQFTVNESYLLDTFCKFFFCFLKKIKITKAYHSIANFNIREKDILGLKINLRKKSLFQFLDKLCLFTAQELPKDISALLINDQILNLNFTVPKTSWIEQQDDNLERNGNKFKENKARFSTLQSTTYDPRISIAISRKVSESLYLSSTFTIKSNQKLTIGVFPEVSFLYQGKNKSGQSFSSSSNSFFSKFSFLCIIQTSYKKNKNVSNCNLHSKLKQTRNWFSLKTIDHQNQMKKVFVSAFQLPIV